MPLKNTVRALTSAGFRYRCPICNWRFRRLEPSAGGAPNAICPNCWSPERTRLLWLYIDRELGDWGKVLHVAPEKGLKARFEEWSHKTGRLYAPIDLAGRNGALRTDLTDLPFKDGVFDTVVCSHVLEHLEDDVAALRELRRVLRGVALLQHPIDPRLDETFEPPHSPDQREELFGQRDHLRLYARDLKRRIERCGFEVEVVDYAAKLDYRERERFRLDRKVTVQPLGPSGIPIDPPPTVALMDQLELDRIYVCR